MVTDGELDNETGGVPDNWAANNATLTQADSSADPGDDSTGHGSTTKECLKIVDAGANAGAHQIVGAVTAGQVFFLDGIVYNPTANAGTYGAYIRIGNNDPIGSQVMSEILFAQNNAWQSIDNYFTAMVSSSNAYLNLFGEISTGDNTYYDAISLKRLTDCAATGALIVSTLGGSTRSWTSVDTGFNPNLACEWKIFRV